MPKKGAGKSKSKYYAVARGFTPGIYTKWGDCQPQVQGYPGAKYKSFDTKKEAEKFISDNNEVPSPPKISKPSTTSPSQSSTTTTTITTQVSPISFVYADGVNVPLGAASSNNSTSLTPVDVALNPLVALPLPPGGLAPAPEFISIEPPKPPELPLGPEQQQALDLVLNGQNVFFTGSAGTGKSFLLERIKRGLKERGQTVALTAATGIAAVNIGGTTIHKWAGIGFGVPDDLTSPKRDVELQKVMSRAWDKKKNWRETHALVIDEISMISGPMFDDLDRIGRELRGKKDVPFGGLQVILCGDFFQIPPVSKKEVKLAFEGNSWALCNFTHIELRAVYRQSDKEFVDLLNAVRRGTLTLDMITKLRSCTKDLPTEDGIQPTKVFSRNEQVDEINTKKLAELTTPVVEYESNDFSWNIPLLDDKQKERFKSTLDAFISPAKLQLKKGAQVMMTRNIDDTLVNGSRGVVIDFTAYDLNIDRNRYYDNCNYVEEWAAEISAKFGTAVSEKSKRKRETKLFNAFSGKQEGKTVPVYLPVVQFNKGRKYVVKPEVFTSESMDSKVVRVQLPLKLAWALTIHKCQGLTLDKVEITFNGIFEKGQAYVALSRARTLEGLKLIGFDPALIKSDRKVERFYDAMAPVDDDLL